MILDSAADIQEAAKHLQEVRASEGRRIQRIMGHLSDEFIGAAAGIYVPARANNKFKLLVEQARFNVLPIVVDALAQALFVDGYRPTSGSRVAGTQNEEIWDKVWQANRMDARQAILYRSAIATGASYALVLPGDPVPQITPLSPSQITAVYEDAVNDEWPALAMRPIGKDRCEIYDAHHVWTVSIDVEQISTNKVRVEQVSQHGLDVVPVVRFLDRHDAAGSPGKVEPLIPLQQQLNQTTFSLLVTQFHQSHQQRWVTGMELEFDEHGNPVKPFEPDVDNLLQGASPDTKFGAFPQASLDGYLTSRDKAILFVASRAKVPPHNLLIGGGISNISAEALAALEAAHRLDIWEHQVSFGESVEQMLRLAGLAMGDVGTWEDRSAQVVWRDTTPRSLAQVADALGKLATLLGVPARALWERIPGVTDQDIRRWTQLADADVTVDAMLADLQQSLEAQPVAQLSPVA